MSLPLKEQQFLPMRAAPLHPALNQGTAAAPKASLTQRALSLQNPGARVEV